MKKTNKKDIRNKYNLFLYKILLNFDNYKEHFTKRDINKIKKIDILVSELLEKIIDLEIEETEKDLEQVEEEIKSAKA